MSTSRLNIALVGNPNSGKSTLFNSLTGLRQQVSNFPGVTVDKKIGVCILEDKSKVDILDLPGSYSLFPNSTDEKIVVSALLDKVNNNYPDFIIYVADCTHLERHLLLATQLIDLQIPMILALSMSDLVENDKINSDYLQKQLGVPVILISNKEESGIKAVKKEIEKFRNKGAENYLSKQAFLPLNPIEKSTVQEVKKAIPGHNDYEAKITAHHHNWLRHLNAAERINIKSIIGQHGFEDTKLQINETLSRFKKFTPIAKSTLKKSNNSRKSYTEKIDNIITHRVLGPVIFFAIMFFVFQAIYSWASLPMDLIDGFFGDLSSTVSEWLPDTWYASLITDGIIAGLAGVLIFIPQILILFLLIAILEESGYMSRAVFMFDGLMQRFGLNGRSIVALVSSGACAIPAIMSTRTITNWKERLITIMVAPLISCSARIPVYAILVGFVVPSDRYFSIFNTQGLVFMGLYLLGIVAALISAWVFKKLLKSEGQSFLMIELPQYKAPIWKNIFYSVKEKVQTFVIEAGKVIFVISIILWFMASYGPSSKMNFAEEEANGIITALNLNETEAADILAAHRIEASYAGHLGKFIEPVIEPLGFDWKIGIALITSFAAREVFVGTMATIYSIGSNEEPTSIRKRMGAEINPKTGKPVFGFATSLSLLIFYVFAMQCMSTLAVTRRETKSWKWPIIQFVYMTILAYMGSLFVFQLWG